ncbi:trypsin-like peptidase domain-containing protein [Actinomadura alba]|nr:trypsin-like peptidase domain-containing protein [Actinomadura alba]
MLAFVMALTLVLILTALGVVLWTHTSAVPSRSAPQPLTGPAKTGPNEPEPDEALPTSPGLTAARQSIVRIVGSAPQCQHSLHGTGFVYAHERVMINAHTVAGARRGIEAITKNGVRYRAMVVLYDPRRDLAVLRVPGLTLPRLKFNFGARPGDSAVIAGFRKNDTSLSAGAAWIRAEQRAHGPDIYHAGQVTRRIYGIKGKVEQGMSGAPLLATDGTVYGVVFADHIDDPNLGYALTADEVAPSARDGHDRSLAVSTRGCSK